MGIGKQVYNSLTIAHLCPIDPIKTDVKVTLTLSPKLRRTVLHNILVYEVHH